MEYIRVWLMLLYMVLLTNVINVVADPEGFLSLACGASTAFVDKLNISWIPDKNYISTGSVSVLANGNKSVRYFPQPTSTLRSLNCYQLDLQGGVHLIRATFTYHNYDSSQLPPHFHVVLNQTIISSVNLSSQDPWVEELVWSATYPASTYFCLLAIPNGGAPVISSLEVRPLPWSSYKIGLTGSKLLQKLSRINCGEDFQTLRYPADPYDRIWDIDHNYSPVLSSISLSFDGYINETGVEEEPPLAVLQSARLALNLNYIAYLTNLAETGSYIVIAYFVELQNSTTQTVMNILVNSNLQSSNYIIPENFTASERNFTVEASSLLNFTLQGMHSPPLINALEIYRIVDLLRRTDGTQVNTLNAIRSSYSIQQDWEYDPCLPVPWKGVKCSSGSPPLITSLDLSDSNLIGTLLPAFGDLADLKTLNLQVNKLSGSIPYVLDDLSMLEVMNLSSNILDGLIPAFTSLPSLEILDLENNILFGPIPASLGGLSKLQRLNVQNNNLSGPVPSSLKRDGLNLEISGNLCIEFTSCTSPAPASPQLAPVNISASSMSHKNQVGIIAGIAIACVMAIIGVGVFAFFLFKRKHKGETTKSFSYDVRSVGSNLDIKNWTKAKQFPWHELVTASKKFKHEIGKGSFGPVYLGSLVNGQQVAIKMGSNSSPFNSTSFENEVILLSQVHHQNLVSLLGYCEKSKKQLLVYEYMANGSLLDHLYGSRAQHQRLDWKTRVQIVVGAATGIDS
ncbi:hypothetical protein O6H91_11G007600 [Diphasiastrum complanatum]|uniref:Uncharacterized protein n=1 Tax=Diphasiastrum complanatum TaxID=34168 RepID=A0ACC2C6B5_DIPCM|nr:hypothetical protein O6H91_11G007600 [Diphasiastrum complanatum]